MNAAAARGVGRTFLRECNGEEGEEEEEEEEKGGTRHFRLCQLWGEERAASISGSKWPMLECGVLLGCFGLHCPILCVMNKETLKCSKSLELI